MLRFALYALGGLAVLGIAYVGVLVYALSGDAAICRMNLGLHASERQSGEPVSPSSTMCRNIREFCPAERRAGICTPG